jgi:hypothetical protein
MIVTSLEGQRIQDYNPRPNPVDSQRLTELLLGLPRLRHGVSIVASCRLGQPGVNVACDAEAQIAGCQRRQFVVAS